jgi:sulfopyruvate decarboxylase TPP-binding subunit
VETPRIPFGFSLASRLGNALVLIFQSSGLKNKKSAQASLADFSYLIPDCARSLHRGAKGSEVELFWGGFV